jgi:hypothetical protein
VKEVRRFSGRPWTQADDNKLRTLVIAGANLREIGLQLNRTETAVKWRAGRLKIILRKSKFAQRRPQMG